MTQLSILDLATVASGSTPARALEETTAMAREAERLGYHRLWVAEHHAMAGVASSAPAVLIAHLAAATSSIRLGAGGVMLPNHAPLVIAEQFATLEALHPGRIDLGLGRAPGTDHVTARALRRSGDLQATTFPNDVVELIGYLMDGGEPTHPAPTPGRGYLPQMWLLGSSTYSAQLAGHLGLPFSFAYHFAPALVDETLRLYRANFRPSALLHAPHVMVAVSVLCAPSVEEAVYLSASNAWSILQRATGRSGPLVAPDEALAHQMSASEQAYVDAAMASHVIGDSATVRAGLDELVARTGADELMLSTRAFDLQTRITSFSLVAEAYGLSSSNPLAHLVG